MKKAICILIALVCAVTVLPSCHPEETEEGGSASPETVSTPSIVSEISSVVHPPVVDDNSGASSEEPSSGSQESSSPWFME